MKAINSKERIRRGDKKMSRGQRSASVDSGGRIILPPEMALRYGFLPGTEIFIEEFLDGIRLRLPVTHLTKVYVEPTNRCNLGCRTCMRNEWTEPLGEMDEATFARILEGLREFSPVPEVFFGGFGEPLAHPRILEMVSAVKETGGAVELITNGTLLNREMSEKLIAAGLDMLWVSLDGAKPESYADIRLGAALPEVIANLSAFRDACHLAPPPRPRLGIVFVAMKRNIADLPAVLDLGGHVGAQNFLVTHLLPYTAEMRDEILYSRALGDSVFGASLDLPKFDLNKETREPFYQILRSGKNIASAGGRLGEINNLCPFVEKGATAVCWDGKVSPCLPLLHGNKNYLEGRERVSSPYAVGNIREKDLWSLWNEPEYLALRRRVKIFDFSPCYVCGGCSLSEGNLEDCFGNSFPVCGGCLWAQGVIRCP